MGLLTNLSSLSVPGQVRSAQKHAALTYTWLTNLPFDASWIFRQLPQNVAIIQLENLQNKNNHNHIIYSAVQCSAVSSRKSMEEDSIKCRAIQGKITDCAAMRFYVDR